MSIYYSNNTRLTVFSDIYVFRAKYSEALNLTFIGYTWNKTHLKYFTKTVRYIRHAIGLYR